MQKSWVEKTKGMGNVCGKKSKAQEGIVLNEGATTKSVIKKRPKSRKEH